MPIEQNISLKGFLDKNFVLNDQIKKNNIQKVYIPVLVKITTTRNKP